jgi:hypothetical protein
VAGSNNVVYIYIYNFNSNRQLSFVGLYTMYFVIYTIIFFETGLSFITDRVVGGRRCLRASCGGESMQMGVGGLVVCYRRKGSTEALGGSGMCYTHSGSLWYELNILVHFAL